jgi:hypothetical protein
LAISRGLLFKDSIYILSILILQNYLSNMQQAQVEQEDIRLKAERQIKYKGTTCCKGDRVVSSIVR